MTLAALAAIGSVLSAGGAAIASAQENNGAISDLRDLYRRRFAEKDREIAQNETETPENLALMRRLQDMERENYLRGRAMNTVVGGTDAHLAAMQAAGGKIVSDTANNLAERAGAVKRAQRADKQALENQYAQQMFGLRQQKAQTIAQAGGQASKAMAGIAAADWASENPFDLFGFTQEELEKAKNG